VILAARAQIHHRLPMNLPPLLPGTRNVLIVTLFVFVAYVVLTRGVGLPLASWLAIAPTPSIGWAWQWATHWMVSEDGGGAITKLVELAVLYLMGSQYEAMAGSRRLYGLWAFGVIGAALGIFATIWITPVAPFGEASMTSALLCALAVRSAGREVTVPVIGSTSPWLFVVVFGAVALLNTIYFQFAPIVASYAGACGAAYVFERWVRFDGPKKKPRTPSVSPHSKARFRVIQGGGQSSDRQGSDDERPKYLN
jgi:membrane associated rhomboid family serine protease